MSERWNVLDDEQKARGQALIIARDVLSTTMPLSSSLGDRTAYDVIAVATWILDGIDPLAGYEEQEGADVVEAAYVEPVIVSVPADAAGDTYVASGPPTVPVTIVGQGSTS
jgi:hypothetical protein